MPLSIKCLQEKKSGSTVKGKIILCPVFWWGLSQEATTVTKWNILFFYSNIQYANMLVHIIKIVQIRTVQFLVNACWSKILLSVVLNILAMEEIHCRLNGIMMTSVTYMYDIMSLRMRNLNLVLTRASQVKLEPVSSAYLKKQAGLLFARVGDFYLHVINKPRWDKESQISNWVFSITVRSIAVGLV